MFTNCEFESLVKPAVSIDYQHGSLVHQIFHKDVADKLDWKQVAATFIQ